MSETKILYLGNSGTFLGKSVSVLDTLTPLLNSNGYDVRQAIPKKNFIARILFMIVSFFKDGLSAKFILIDTYSTLSFWYVIVISFLCKLFGKKYILFLHGGELEKRLNGKFFNEFVFNNAAQLIAPSNFLKSIFEKHNYHPILIPNILEINNYSFKPRLLSKNRILWVRAFADFYNPQLAIKAIQKILKSGVEVSLCMVGPDKDGTLEKCKELVNEYKINDHVRFTGRLDKKDWLDLSKDFDVFINTTTVDNTPVSVIEALALGLPVISTRVGGIPYLLEHNKNALLVDSNNIDQLSNSILRLYNDKELLKQLSLNGRELAESFDWEMVKHKWDKVLNDE